MADEVTKKRQFTAEEVQLIRTKYAEAPQFEFDTFLYQCERTGLDPIAGQIHLVKRFTDGAARWVTQTAIDGMRLVADRTGAYAGSDKAAFGAMRGDFPSIASVTVYKLVGGIRCPFEAEARWAEFYPGDKQGFMWRKMPHVMLGKCAEAQALRKAFPADLSGLYEAAEMDQAGVSEADQKTAPKDSAATAAEKRNGAPGAAGAVKPPQGKEAVQAAKERVAAEITQPAAAPTKPKAETAAVPQGRQAFGYVPTRWPLVNFFEQDPTDSQLKTLTTEMAKKNIEVQRAMELVATLANVYVVPPIQNLSKGAYMLAIDFLMSASDAQVRELTSKFKVEGAR